MDVIGNSLDPGEDAKTTATYSGEQFWNREGVRVAFGIVGRNEVDWMMMVSKLLDPCKCTVL